MRLTLLLSVLLLGVSWAVTQNTPAQTTPKSYSQTTTSTGSQTSVEGCLSSSAGKYMLTDKNGKMYELTGETSKLAEHVGHEVKITGTESPAGSTAASSGAMSNQSSLEVSSVKHISKTCKSGGMAK
jgi:hypothetical protein